MSTTRKVRASPFFGTWSGHPPEDLQNAISLIQQARPKKPIIYLAGDSSLDNKAWTPSSGPAGEPLPVPVPSIYKAFLEPATPKPDIAFWLNHILKEQATCLNSAVEASTLRNRRDQLLTQDEFLRDHIQPQDILVVSIGANDIALAPTFSTIWHMGRLAWLTPRYWIDSGNSGSLKYFKHMFGSQTQEYINRLVCKTKPRSIIICMIYFPYEGKQPGWADIQLKLLGYNWFPKQLQAVIKEIFEQATTWISIPGTRVIPCQLFEALNGKIEEDYVARVEPSVQGGQKMAELLARIIKPLLDDNEGHQQ